MEVLRHLDAAGQESRQRMDLVAIGIGGNDLEDRSRRVLGKTHEGGRHSFTKTISVCISECFPNTLVRLSGQKPEG